MKLSKIRYYIIAAVIVVVMLYIGNFLNITAHMFGYQAGLIGKDCSDFDSITGQIYYKFQNPDRNIFGQVISGCELTQKEIETVHLSGIFVESLVMFLFLFFHKTTFFGIVSGANLFRNTIIEFGLEANILTWFVVLILIVYSKRYLAKIIQNWYEER